MSYSDEIIVEDKEFVKDSEGNVMQVQNAPSHDSKQIYVDGKYQQSDKGRGGLVMAGIESVVSSTKRSSKSKLGGKMDEAIRILPNDLKEIEANLLLDLPSIKSFISPARCIEMILAAKKKIIAKYKKDIIDNDNSLEYLNTIECHRDILESLPTDGEIYDLILALQEKKKLGNPLLKYL